MLSNNPLMMWTLCVGAGLLLTLIIVLLPKHVKVFLGRFLPPNWASVVHVIFGWFGFFALYVPGYFLVANLVLGFSGGLDKYDGMEARAFDKLVGTPLKSQGFWDQMNHRGTTPLGKVLDPLADKVTLSPMYLYVVYVILERVWKGEAEQVSYLLFLAVSLIVLMLIADTFGQVIRMKRFRHWHAREDNSATLVGKIKSTVQWIWLAFFPVWQHGWISEPEVYLLFLDFLLAIMLALAAVSASSKIKPFREIWNGKPVHE